MSWRYFASLLSGLSGDAVYRHVTAKQRRVIDASNAGSFFAMFKKAGE